MYLSTCPLGLGVQRNRGSYVKRLITLASLALALVVLPATSPAQFLHLGYTQQSDVDGNIGARVAWDGGGNNQEDWRIAIVQAKADPVSPMRITALSMIAGLEDENLAADTEVSLVRLGPEANFVNLSDAPTYAPRWSLGMMTNGTGNWGNLANFGGRGLKEYTFGGLASHNITLAPGQDEWFGIVHGMSLSGSSFAIPTSDITGYRSYYGYRDQTPMYRQLPFNGASDTWGINISASPVPEPATIATLLVGAASLLFRRRSRR